jgi:hypothetical protein
MTDTPSADDLARENDRLRQENDDLRDGLRTTIRRQAAAEAGLDPDAARWINGDSLDDAVADAHKLAALAGTGTAPTTPPASPEGAAIQKHLAETHQATAAVVDTDQIQEN